MSPVQVERALNGAALRLKLANGKGNIIDSSVVRAFTDAFTQANKDSSLRCVLVEADGGDFSFGASVEEHRPPQAPAMLRRLHALIAQMLNTPLPVLAAIRGRCLGGGLELALACSRVYVSSDAKLGNPEVKLGVFAPAASALLPRRVGPAYAEELLVTGRTVDASEASRIGLVDVVCAEGEDPAFAALAWAEKHLLSLSKSALRVSVRASRAWVKPALEQLYTLERLYLDEVVDSPDGIEGIEAFIARRSPNWSH